LLGRRCGQCCNDEKIENQMLHILALYPIRATSK
jgi:hypothetical protein